MADRPPIRYAIYTRQSNQGLFDFSSCDAQFLTCQNHIKKSGEAAASLQKIPHSSGHNRLLPGAPYLSLH
jgi:hypothetical protein